MTTDSADFADLADPFRPELLAHCYRMLGSIHDAEDLVQETYLRAWRSFDRFEGRSSLRLWLHKIATRACLTALEQRSRRPLPSGLAGPSDDHSAAAVADLSVDWLQPVPDALVTQASADPAAVVASRVGVRLAFVAALQHLSPRQRAVLVLRDVLAMRAADVAEVLGTSPSAVNSALLRARAQMTLAAPTQDELGEPVEADVRDVVDRYVDAFQRGDVAALAAVLQDDVQLEMPPIRTWFSGRDDVVGFLAARVVRKHGDWRLTRTRANGQDAVVAYARRADGSYHAHGVLVLGVLNGRIARIVAFNDASLVPLFGAPMTLPAADAAATGTGG